MSSSYYDQEVQFGFGQGGITFTVQLLILVNTGVLAVQLLLDVPFGGSGMIGGGHVLDYLGFSSERVMQGWVWTPFTYMFLHGGLQHLFFNMLMLFFFGPDVERLLGTRQFLRFYALCGTLGVLFNLIPALMGGRSLPIVGASGAVLGVLVAFAMVNPDRRVFLFPFPFPITSRALVIVIIAFNLLGAASGGTGTSVVTHLGGMVTAFVYMKYRPLLLQRQLKRGQRGAGPSNKDREKMGEAVDNIFKFGDKDRH